MIPKYENSDLSDDFLNLLSIEDALIYVENNSELLQGKCKWLDDSKIPTICTAYERRSSDCRNYCSDTDCKIGKHRLKL